MSDMFMQHRPGKKETILVFDQHGVVSFPELPFNIVRVQHELTTWIQVINENWKVVLYATEWAATHRVFDFYTSLPQSEKQRVKGILLPRDGCFVTYPRPPNAPLGEIEGDDSVAQLCNEYFRN